MKRIHLVGAKTRRQFALHAAAVEEATKKKSARPPARAFEFEGFSGRGVELRTLDTSERDLAQSIAAKSTGEDGTMADLRARMTAECIQRMVIGVTDPGLDESALAKATYKKVTQLELDGNLGKFFTPKDIDVLTSLYRRWHEATMEDLDAIEGKAVDVAVDA